MTAYQETLRHCAGLFRLGRDVEAAMSMVELLDGLLAELGGAPEGLQLDTAVLLSAVFAAQQRQDWISLADSLEYDLVKLIDRAGSV